MSKNIKIRDFFSIVASEEIQSLDDDARVRICDAAMSEDRAVKGLEIEFILSSSDKVINNRIYPSGSQRAGAHTWTEPFPRPILLNHDTNRDPIGRITDVQWVPNDHEAGRFFGSMQDYHSFKDEIRTGDAQRVYRALSDRGLLQNKSWPGTGNLIATALIVDEDAIQKFLDGRYLTFSSGATTDAFGCGICGSDWASGDVCDHRPGRLTDDGEMPAFVTGKYIGDEASVVNKPANSTSQLTRMELTDSMVDAGVEVGSYTAVLKDLESHTWAVKDTALISGDNMDKETPKEAIALADMDPRVIAMELFNGKEVEGLADALEAESHLETTFLIRIHDALHREYDWSIRYADEQTDPLPAAVFKLHGKIHDLSMEKEFRDSLINGPLDGRGADGEESDAYMLKPVQDAETDDVDAIVKKAYDDAEESIVKKVLAALDARAATESAAEPNSEESNDAPEELEVADSSNEEEVTDDQEAQEEAQEEVSVLDTVEDTEAVADSEVEEIVYDESIDWGIFDLALQMEVGDARLSTEQREELPAEVFCGSERRFPVSDKAHFTAALRLLNRSKLTDDQKSGVRASVIQKGVDAGWLTEERAEVLRTSDSVELEDTPVCANCELVQKDYAAALALIEQLKDESTKKSNEIIDNAEELQDNKSVSEEIELEDRLIENPSVAGAEEPTKIKTLGDFERRMVEKYCEIRDQSGQRAANAYLGRYVRRGYLPRDFDIRQYVEDTE